MASKAGKKAVAKKAPAKRKASAKKAPAKKAPAKKKAAAKKAAAKKAPAKKKASAKKAPAGRKAKEKKTPLPPVRTPAREPAPAAPGTRRLTAKEMDRFKKQLLELRERVAGEYTALSRDNLEANQRDPSLSDQGTDTFDREMELNMMGSEQDVLYEIDDALRRIEKKTFGICELTGEPINIERLTAIPYVRYTVRAQSELEKGRARYRPFGGTMRG